jgi:hypothetical protein
MHLLLSEHSSPYRPGPNNLAYIRVTWYLIVVGAARVLLPLGKRTYLGASSSWNTEQQQN